MVFCPSSLALTALTAPFGWLADFGFGPNMLKIVPIVTGSLQAGTSVTTAESVKLHAQRNQRVTQGSANRQELNVTCGQSTWADGWLLRFCVYDLDALTAVGCKQTSGHGRHRPRLANSACWRVSGMACRA